MEDDLQESIELSEMMMNDAIDRLKRELLKISTGKASPAMVNDLFVNYYGSPTPLKQEGEVEILLVSTAMTCSD